ncbi:MAG: N-acetylglucosamine kinase [Bacteroidetes bacterium]|nr:N-acetylglucosamine kinase [Bacteroidota bacterium]MBS1634172.1 N-acetylglucosamine kinase [Bacteroidota bacterium]
MATNKLIADSGATKAEWCLLSDTGRKTFFTQGISPYFLNAAQISDLLLKELKPKLKNKVINEVHYYGTGCASPDNAAIVKKAILQVFAGAKVHVDNDLTAAAKSVCGRNKGMVGNLGTGSFCCYYDGKKIAKQTPGIGYALGDEGSGAYLGKKVIQYYLYDMMDEDLRARFDAKYVTNRAEILENVYKKPLPNRYLAGYAIFLAENRGHYMVENIIEDGLNDFFFHHLRRYKETLILPVHFVGGIAFGFKDVLLELCNTYQMIPGKILKNPMPGLIEYHS